MAWSLGALLGLVACESPGSRRIVGPDGSPMAHVHCGADQGECFRIAGELCPSGYEMKPVLSGADGNFLVRCHGAAPVLADAPLATPALVAAAPPTLAPTGSPPPSSRDTERWPPTGEPWPLMYPWPPPETSAAAQPARAATPAPKTPSGTVDLGY